MPGELTVQQAAEMKGVTPQAVRRAIQRGRLRARPQHAAGQARGRWSLLAEDVMGWAPARTQTEKGKRRGLTTTNSLEASRREAIRAARGSLAGGRVTLSDYLSEKHAETRRER